MRQNSGAAFLDYLSLLTLMLALTISACSSQTPQEQIYTFIEKAAQTAQKKKAKALGKMISENYTDSRGLVREDLIRIAAGYFFRQGTIFIKYRVEEPVIAPDQQSATVHLIAALSRHELESNFDLPKAEFHQFELELAIENGKWLLSRLEWKKASLDDYLSVAAEPDSF